MASIASTSLIGPNLECLECPRILHSGKWGRRPGNRNQDSSSSPQPGPDWSSLGAPPDGHGSPSKGLSGRISPPEGGQITEIGRGWPITRGNESIQTRQVARTINDTKKAHEKLDAKVLDCIDALQNIRTQDKGQVKIWFEEWQTEVDAFTTWIYRQENALEDEIERQENAVSPKTSRRRARL